jgi:ferritin-like metal-binding protein YciE
VSATLESQCGNSVATRELPQSSVLSASHGEAVRNFIRIGDAMSVETLQELFIDELKDLYSAEKQIVRSLPKLAKAASTPELKDALQSHLEETKGQVERLEQIAGIVGKKLTGKTCAGMKGVLEEGSEVLEEVEEGNVRDAALIGASQRVEHYEMAGYGTARDFAKLLGLEDVVELLEQTLEEEKAADQKLTAISKNVNRQAKAEMSEAA